MIYEIQGKLEVAATPHELVTKLYNSPWVRASSIKKYMDDVALRIFKTTGEKLNVKDCETFVDSLISHGYIKVIKTN